MQTPFIYGEKDVPNVHVFGRLLLNQLQSPWQKVNLSRYEYGDPRMKPGENEIFKRQRQRDRDKRQKFVSLREELRKVKQ